MVDDDPLNQLLGASITYRIAVGPKCGGESKAIAGIEEQAVNDKIFQHSQAKAALPPPTELLPATRVSPTSDWFAWRQVFTSLCRTISSAS